MRTKTTRFLKQDQVRVILQYPENLDILLVLLQRNTLRTQEIVDWVMAHYKRSPTSIHRRLRKILDVGIIKKTIRIDRTVEYSIVWAERKMIRSFLKTLGYRSIREEEGSLIETYAGNYATYRREK